MQEALEDVNEECQRLEARAEQLRGEGKETEAEILERLAELLAKEGIELAEKRRKMPFGLDSAEGFGEVMENPAITLAEQMQRGEDHETS